MPSIRTGIAIGIACIASVPSASADVLTFEGLPTPGFGGVYPTGILTDYGGFTWENGYNYLRDSVQSNGYYFGVVSGEQAMFNGFEQPITVTRSTRWDFTGAYFTAAWNTGLNVQLEAFRDGVSVSIDSFVLGDPVGPTWREVNFLDIDSLRISSSGGVLYWSPGSGAHLVIDNFTFVPAPGAIALLGLAGLASRRRRA